MGNIGSRVAELATAFGMEVSYYSTSGTGHCRTYPCVSLGELLGGSDIVSVNCPLNPKTRDLITYTELGRMKPGAYIVNCSRGGIINENDLVRALNVKDPSRLILSPHIGWTSIEARIRLVEVLEENIRSFLESGK